MRYSSKRRVALGITTGGLLMSGFGMAVGAQADSRAVGDTAQSPGIGSGNLVQLPVDAPVQICGNQVDVIGILDAVPNDVCGIEDDPDGSARASGHSVNSPGIGSGDIVEAPVNGPLNVCDNQLNVIGVGNAVGGGSCANDKPAPAPGPGTSTPPTPGVGTSPVPRSGIGPKTGTPIGPPDEGGTLARTGSGALTVAPLSAGLIGGGILLRRRFPGRTR